MTTIDDAYAETEKALDRILATEKEAVRKSIKKLEKQLLDRAAELKTAEDAILASASLKRALDYQKDLIRAMSDTYGVATDNLVQRLEGIELLVQSEYKALDIGLRWTSTDKGTLRNLRIAINSEFSAFGDHLTNEVSKPIYDIVLTGGSFSDLVAGISGVLTGPNGSTGLLYIAERKAHDMIMSYYTANQITAAKRTKIDTFLYYGNVIASTRSFCKSRAGRVYSIEEIDTWNSLSWKGKKPGNVLLNRGGYNCRHSFHPVKKRWVEEGLIEVQRYQG